MRRVPKISQRYPAVKFQPSASYGLFPCFQGRKFGPRSLDVGAQLLALAKQLVIFGPQGGGNGRAAGAARSRRFQFIIGWSLGHRSILARTSTSDRLR
jgi:hypothetical protein